MFFEPKENIVVQQIGAVQWKEDIYILDTKNKINSKWRAKPMSVYKPFY
jgi:hypothetical protein